MIHVPEPGRGREPAVQKNIIEFTNILRNAGIRVSVAEAIDSFMALDEMTLDDRELFRDALRTTMVKHSDDIPTYDRLFSLFWSGFHDQLRDELQAAMAAMGADFDLDELLDQIREMLEQMDGDVDLTELARALLTVDANALEKLIQQAGQDAGIANIKNMLQIGFFSRRMMEQMGMEGAGVSLRELMDQLAEAGMSEEDLQRLGELMNAVQDAGDVGQ